MTNQALSKHYQDFTMNIHELNLKWPKNAEKHLLRQKFSMSPLPMYSKAQQLSSIQDTGEWLPVRLKNGISAIGCLVEQ